MKFALKDVLPNPNRDLVLNPLKQDKIDSLMESIEETGYWENVVGRKAPGGKLELGYGHHRYEALLRLYGKDFSTDFIVKDLSDDDMRQMMARENDETYRNDTVAVMESVQAAVRALAEGKVSPEKLPAPDPKTKKELLRYAPSYITGHDGRSSTMMAYTADTLARYLGYTKSREGRSAVRADEKIIAALVALENMERGLWDKKTIQTFRKTADGPILADRVIQAGRDKQVQADRVRQNEAAKAEAQRVAGLSLQAQLNRAAAEKKRAQAEEDRLMKARLEATRKEDEEKAARLKQEVAEAKQKRIDAEKKRKQAEKEWEANQKAREASLEAQRKAEVDKEKRLEAQRRSFVKDECDQIARVLTNEHALFEELKVRGRDKRTTDEERKRFRLELEELSERALQARVFFYPELGKQIVKR